jgi:hypothetical protein
MLSLPGPGGGGACRRGLLFQRAAHAELGRYAGAGSIQGPKPVGSAGAAARLTAGTVTVRSGGKVVCVMTIKDGKGTCTVSAKDYKPGTVSFTGAYSGGDGMKASTSKPISA